MVIEHVILGRFRVIRLEQLRFVVVAVVAVGRGGHPPGNLLGRPAPPYDLLDGVREAAVGLYLPRDVVVSS